MNTMLLLVTLMVGCFVACQGFSTSKLKLCKRSFYYDRTNCTTLLISKTNYFSIFAFRHFVFIVLISTAFRAGPLRNGKSVNFPVHRFIVS